jgi:hypothetical protein
MIKYDVNTDLALDSLQTFTATFEEYKDDMHGREYKIDDETDYALLVLIKNLSNIQSAVNKSTLRLLESILENNYPRTQQQK